PGFLPYKYNQRRTFITLIFSQQLSHSPLPKRGFGKTLAVHVLQCDGVCPAQALERLHKVGDVAGSTAGIRIIGTDNQYRMLSRNRKSGQKATEKRYHAW